uniref:Uncharacterized protein n=1 Tax=Salix viminalis TaxID=40686 RepID=A0A6N2LYQ3_SALVM
MGWVLRRNLQGMQMANFLQNSGLCRMLIGLMQLVQLELPDALLLVEAGTGCFMTLPFPHAQICQRNSI